MTAAGGGRGARGEKARTLSSPTGPRDDRMMLATAAMAVTFWFRTSSPDSCVPRTATCEPWCPGPWIIAADMARPPPPPPPPPGPLARFLSKTFSKKKRKRKRTTNKKCCARPSLLEDVLEARFPARASGRGLGPAFKNGPRPEAVPQPAVTPGRAAAHGPRAVAEPAAPDSRPSPRPGGKRGGGAGQGAAPAEPRAQPWLPWGAPPRSTRAGISRRRSKALRAALCAGRARDAWRGARGA